MVKVETNLPEQQRELVERSVRNVLEARGGEWEVKVTRSDESPHWEFEISGAAKVSFPFVWPGSAEDEAGRIEQSVKQNVARALGEEAPAIDS